MKGKNKKMTEPMEYLAQAIIDAFDEYFINDGIGVHDVSHVMRVMQTAYQIYFDEKSRNPKQFSKNSETIITLASLLHDIDDYKITGDCTESTHNADKVMSAVNIPDHIQNTVRQIIKEVPWHNHTKPSTIEGQIVQDADRLDALGYIGIARIFAYGGSNHRLIYNPLESKKPPEQNEYMSNTRSSFSHFNDKILKIKEKMNTKLGKKIAKEKTKIVTNFMDGFLKEWNEGMPYGKT